ncbi:MAG: FHA domain-containing protein [Butyrivibrio sp.]|uniref:FHA domain-containing protein n=1 Tax=Butyrivibrio sp. TaxID=28121 RepID=UPI0025DB6EC3|nr:FHA domain-containing protein [Butyrivibrio sp.]MCR5772078.1 FHA domain-containing protein [Butyrivibrio sp.]
MNINKSFSHISYTLDNEEYSKLALKMLAGSKSLNIIKPVNIRNNGARRFMYSVKDLSELTSVCSGLDEGSICLILSRYKGVIREIESQTFLKKKFLELEPDRIFIDSTTREVKFIIVPAFSDSESDSHRIFLEKNYSFISRIFGNRESFVDRRLQDLSKICVDIKGKKEDDTSRIEWLEKLFAYISKEYDQNCVIKEDDADISDIENSMKIKEIELNYDGEYGIFTFYITKKTFFIGKSDGNDGILAMNPAVSRTHCRIDIDGDKVYITDLGSSNHTYIDGLMITDDQNVLLKDGSVLRIADMDFKVVFNYE